MGKLLTFSVICKKKQDDTHHVLDKIINGTCHGHQVSVCFLTAGWVTMSNNCLPISRLFSHRIHLHKQLGPKGNCTTVIHL